MAKIYLKDARAIAPFKSIASDVGFNLTLIDIFNTDADVVFYETGISAIPPVGFYFEVVPSSLLSSTGYILANSGEIINPDYTDTIKVQLIKNTKQKPDLVLPFIGAQLVLKAENATELYITDNAELHERGTGGKDKPNKGTSGGVTDATGGATGGVTDATGGVTDATGGVTDAAGSVPDATKKPK